MTRPSTNSRNNYIGTGTTGPFSFTFPVFAVTDLRVVRRVLATGVETVLVYAADFTTSTVFPATSGSITLTTALAVGETLTIRRGPAITQLTSFRSQGPYTPAMHEDAFDRSVDIDQHIWDELGRSLRVPESLDPSTLDLAVTPETGKALVWQSSTQLGNSLLDSSAIALPGGGRTVATTSAYLANNAIFNVLDFAPAGYVAGVTDATAMIQATLNALPARGGRVEVPSGTYIIGSTINMPADSSDGRTIELVGLGEAILYNKAAASNPTLKMYGPSGGNPMRGVKIRNLIFTGELAYPNHGIQAKWFIESYIEDCIFTCHGNAIRIVGGVFGLVFRKLQIWPTGRRHSSPSTHTGSTGILFDTPELNAEYAHTITFDDIIVEAGGRGIELKTGYSAYAWRFGRILTEGLTGGNGYGLDLTGLHSSEIGPLYSELNSTGTMGDANDLQMRLHQCFRIDVCGGYGSGNIVVTSSEDINFFGTVCNNFNANSTNARIHLRALRHSIMGTGASGYTNNSTEKIEEALQGPGPASTRNITGIIRRGATTDTGAGTNDDVRGTTAVDGGVQGAAIRWVDAAGTGTAPRYLYQQKSIINDGVFITGLSPRATVKILTDGDQFAEFQVRGTGSAPVELFDPQAIFTAVKDTAGSYNCYIETGDFRVQNKTGATRLVTLFWFIHSG